MNREIKFRAWDKRNEAMCSWESVGRLSYSQPFSLFADSNYKWMQFTGLKDKNGVEIYEGDVLEHAFDECETDESEYAENGRPFVTFDYGSFRYEYRNWKADALIGLPLDDNTGHLIVVGNVHENPELLKNGDTAQTAIDAR